MAHDDTSEAWKSVEIEPLPKHMHGEFCRFVAQVARMAERQEATWKTSLTYSQEPWQFKTALYWQSVRRFLHHLEWLGVRSRDTRRNSSRNTTHGSGNLPIVGDSE